MFIKRSRWENELKEKSELQKELSVARERQEYFKNILFTGIDGYINAVYVKPDPRPEPVEENSSYPHTCFQTVSLSELFPDGFVELEEEFKHIQPSFSDKLMGLIRDRNLNEVEIYKKAEIDRRHFSKMRSHSSYRPSKDTIILLCLSMELNYDEAVDLLQRAGLSLSKSSKKDIIAEYFLKRRIYDIMVYKEVLNKYGFL